MTFERDRVIIGAGRTVALIVFLALASAIVFTGGAANSSDAGIVSAQEDNQTEYFDDFEDGDLEGWEQVDADAVSISNESFWGDYSVLATDDSANDGTSGEFFWSNGPHFDTGDNFEISGTYRVEGSNSGQSVTLGVRNLTQQENAMIVYDYETGHTYLSTHWAEDAPSETIETDYKNTWVNFRLQFDGGTARLQVWEAGTSRPDEWQLERQFSEFEGRFRVSAGNGNNDRQIYLDQIDAGGRSISGQVVDQDGNPVHDATVEAYGVDYDVLNESAENLNETAEELLDEAEAINDTPSAYDPGFDIGEYIPSSGNYVLGHQPDDYGSGLMVTHDAPFLDDQVDDPRIQLDPNEPQLFSIWDPTDEPRVLPQDRFESSFPGGIDDSDSLVIEQHALTNEVVSTQTREPEFTIRIKRLRSDIEHDVVKTDLDTGFYTVYPESNPSARMTVVVGEREDIGNQIVQDLRDSAGSYTTQAQRVRDQIESGPFRRVTTTTNETGHFDLRMQQGVERAAVQAYRADGQFLQRKTGPTIDDLRDAHLQGYNGSYFIAAPERTDVPEKGVTIQGYETPTLPWQDLQSVEDLSQWIEDEFEAWLAGEIDSPHPSQLIPEDTPVADLRATLDSFLSVVDANEAIRERYLEISNRDELPDPEDLDSDQLVAEIGYAQEAISTAGGSLLPPEDIESRIEDGLLNARFPHQNGLNESATEVVIHWTDGGVTAVDDQYVSVESDGILGGDTVVVEDVPIEDLAGGREFAQLKVHAVAENGQTATSDHPIRLPGFDGIAESPEAIKLSDLRPAPDDTVRVELVAGEDSSIDRVTDARVVGPSGTDAKASVTDDFTVTFRPGAAGKHVIQITYVNGQGSELATVTTLDVTEEPQSAPPTVRVEQVSFGEGRIAVVGEHLQTARVGAEGDTLDIAAIQTDRDGAVNELNVRAMEETTRDSFTVDIQVMQSDKETVKSHVLINLHTRISGEALIYHAAGPITHGGDTRFGQVEHRELSGGDVVRIINTRTDANGALEGLEVNNDPGWLERMEHWVAVHVPTPSLPSLGLLAVTVLGGGARARRRWLV